MRFLLDHEPFQKNLNYVLMYMKTINDSRVYNEMYIENWWWKRQNELFVKVIMISVLMIIDKFQIIKHCDDHNL